jgi:hypothetical protein
MYGMKRIKLLWNLLLKQNSGYIPPFDHPSVWAGNSTIIDEVIQQCEKPDVVIAAVGGGLLSGVLDHNLKKLALHIYEFHGIKNRVVPVQIKIDASKDEIQLAKPVIVIGPLDDIWRNCLFTQDGNVDIFIAFALPFIFSIILLLFKSIILSLFKYIKQKT